MSIMTKKTSTAEYSPELKKELQEAVRAGLLAPEDGQAIKQAQIIAEAEARAITNAIPESKRLYKLQEIRIDQFCTLRRRVLLTPSMCRIRGCGFDGAKEVGYLSGWNTVPHDQLLPTGKTVGEAILGLLDHHRATAHALDESHIMTEDQVQKQKQWAGVPGAFLTNPGRT